MRLILKGVSPRQVADFILKAQRAFNAKKNSIKTNPELQRIKVPVKGKHGTYYATRYKKREKNKEEKKVDNSQSDVIHSRAFKRWFGDWENAPQEASKVVGSDDQPKKQHNLMPVAMFHGSPSLDITIFDVQGKQETEDLIYGKGAYFTDSEEDAKHFAMFKGKQDAEGYFTADTAEKVKSIFKDVAREYNFKERSQSDTGFRFFAGKLNEIYSDIMDVDKMSYEQRARLGGVQRFKSNIQNLFNKYSKSAKMKNPDVKRNAEDALEVLNELQSRIYPSLEGKKEKYRIYKCYLNIRNPFDIDNDAIEYEGMYYSYEELVDKGVRKSEIKDILTQEGYDGLTVKGYKNEPTRWWIAFEANQVKSAENNITFDPDKDNIYKALKNATI